MDTYFPMDAVITETTSSLGALSTTVYQHYLEKYSSVPGWFLPEAIAIWDVFLSFQTSSNIVGNFLEIGIFCGKSAALSTLHARENETCVFVDPMIHGEARSLLNQIKPTNMVYAPKKSSDLPATGLLASNARSFRWIHIDGDHSGDGVMNDLHIASELLSPEGIITIDDFFSPAYPQITAAVFYWLQTRRLEFQLLMCGYNKAYLCRTSAFHRYAVFTKTHFHDELTRRVNRPLTIWKSTHPSDLNTFGVWEWAHMKYRGPDWDHSLIQI